MTNEERTERRLHRGLYEAHLPVVDLERAIDFYVARLGFERGFGTVSEGSVLLLYDDAGTRWMLGLFEVGEIRHRHPAEYHVAFRVSSDDLDRVVPWLRKRGIEPTHPPGAPLTGSMDEPIVHGWMPAASVFFRDPDGHLLEMIADLAGPPRPEFAYRPLSEWRRITAT